MVDRVSGNGMPTDHAARHPVRTRVVAANGLRFTTLEAGMGPLALCLHGFPDTAHTWEHLLPELAAAGFHAVAPFLRGYAPTEIAPDGDYRLPTLVADILALHGALGGDGRAVLIGQDWGAEIAYLAAAQAPGRWRRVVTLAVPPFTLDERIFADYDQLRRFFYFFLLRSPLAEQIVAAHDLAFLDRLWADWSPGYDASESLAHVKHSLRAAENLRAVIGYYRDYPMLAPDDTSEAPAAGPQPTLYLHGEADGCIAADLVRDAGQHLAPGSRMRVITGAGHFPHLEKRAEVTQLILEWLTA
jgi:pimeloyl-ACP methyl ester carboxylesterase